MTPLRVLNTRPREQAAELSALLRVAGFEAVEASAIAIERAWSAHDFEATLSALASGSYACVVLQSANAACGLEEHLPNASVVCGASTARALDLDAAVTLERFSAAAALEAMTPVLRAGDRVLVPRAAEGRDELVDGLRALGVEVDAPVAYRTVATEDAASQLRLGGIDVVTLCSPSAVAPIAAAVPREALVVCIGATTADAARAHGVRVDAVADQTSMRSLVHAIERLAGARV